MLHYRLANATHIRRCKVRPIEDGEQEKQSEHPNTLEHVVGLYRVWTISQI